MVECAAPMIESIRMNPGDVYFFSANSYVLCVESGNIQQVTPTSGVGLNPNATVFHSHKEGVAEGATDTQTQDPVPPMNGLTPSPSSDSGVTFVNGDVEARLPSNVTFPPTPEESPPVPAIVSDNGVVSDNTVASDKTAHSYPAANETPSPPALEAQTLFPPKSTPVQDASPSVPSNHGSPHSDESVTPEDSGMPLDQLKASLRHYLEYYFSRENLAQDSYLVSQMDADQYVLISTIAKFNQVKKLTNNLELVVEVLRDSPNVQVDDKGEKVRPMHQRCVVILREVPESTPVKDVENLFTSEYCPKFVSCEFASSDCWYVTFDSEEDAQRAFLYLRTQVQTFLGRPIMARIKAKPILRSTYVPKAAGNKVVAGQQFSPVTPPTDFTPTPALPKMAPPPFQQAAVTPAGVPSVSFITQGGQATTPVVSVSQSLPFFPPHNTNLFYQTAPQQGANVTYYDPGTAFAANGYTPSATYKLPNPATKHSFQNLRNTNTAYRNQKQVSNNRYTQQSQTSSQPSVLASATHHHVMLPQQPVSQPSNHHSNHTHSHNQPHTQPTIAISTPTTNQSSNQAQVEPSVVAVSVQNVEAVGSSRGSSVNNERHSGTYGQSQTSASDKVVTHATYSDQHYPISSAPPPANAPNTTHAPQRSMSSSAGSSTSTGAANVAATPRQNSYHGASSGGSSQPHHHHGNTAAHSHNNDSGTAPLPPRLQHHHGSSEGQSSGSNRHSEVSVNRHVNHDVPPRHAHAEASAKDSSLPPRHAQRRERERQERGEDSRPRGGGGDRRTDDDRRGDDRGYYGRPPRSRRAGARGQEDETKQRSVGSSTREKPPQAFDLEANSFPPLPGSAKNTSANGVFENKMSDVVRGTAKSSVAVTTNASTSTGNKPTQASPGTTVAKETSTSASSQPLSVATEKSGSERTEASSPKGAAWEGKTGASNAVPPTPPLSPHKMSKSTSTDKAPANNSPQPSANSHAPSTSASKQSSAAAVPSDKATSAPALSKPGHAQTSSTANTHSANTHSAQSPKQPMTGSKTDKTDASTAGGRGKTPPDEKSTGTGPLSPPASAAAPTGKAAAAKAGSPPVNTPATVQNSGPPKMSYAAILQQKKQAELENAAAVAEVSVSGGDKAADKDNASAGAKDQSSSNSAVASAAEQPVANGPASRSNGEYSGGNQYNKQRSPTRNAAQTEHTRAKADSTNGDYVPRYGGESRGSHPHRGDYHREYNRDSRGYYGHKDSGGRPRGGYHRGGDREYVPRGDRDYRDRRGSERGDRDSYRNDRDSYRNDRDNYRSDRDSYRNDRDSYRNDRDSYRGGDRDSYRHDHRDSYRDSYHRDSYRGDRETYRPYRGSYRRRGGDNRSEVYVRD